MIYSGHMIPTLTATETLLLDDVLKEDRELAQRFSTKTVLQPALTRSLVSFQANKKRPLYRWYKFKEAFSAGLVEFLFSKYDVKRGSILDPFAGSGTSLFVASEMRIRADGIELLPIGQQVIKTKILAETELVASDIERIHQWADEQLWHRATERVRIDELRITKGAYPEGTHIAIEQYLGAMQQENERVQTILRFALLCVLEQVSYTRKDGQYLRWDYRSGRKQGSKPFDKGVILEFDQAIKEKICEILQDLDSNAPQPSLFARSQSIGEIRVWNGSCLKLLPTLSAHAYDAIITSPPYCNRYDYTRTYALELALLGVDEMGLTTLRQEMLSCTVENRGKDLRAMNSQWEHPLAVADAQKLLQAILNYLDAQKARGVLNNNGIPRMVRGYFYEMACVIFECARVMKKGAPLFMVNDNVRYAGASISVDLILSAMAQELGFQVEQILVLPSDKGNSSQQMGEHGRDPLRKCVYVWRKP